MKNKKVLLVAAASLLATLAVASCSPHNDGQEIIDTSKTQIYAFCYDGGYGTTWLDSLKQKYETLHKEDSYEEGKKGVQILITGQKETTEGFIDKITTQKYDIYFGEGSLYDDLIRKNAVMDITEAVTGTNESYAALEEGGSAKSIESKMDDASVEYFKIDGHYYAVPHYIGSCGINFNRDLFDDKGFYFVDKVDGIDTSTLIETIPQADIKGYWYGQSGQHSIELSKGPDGKTGIIDGYDYSFDDGLPATYDQFFKLCDYISDQNCKPITLQGYSADDYEAQLVNAISATHEIEDMKLNYTFSGTANHIVKYDGDNVVLDGNGNPVVMTANISIESKSDLNKIGVLAKQLGKYYGIEFTRRLVTEVFATYDDLSKTVTNKGYMHTAAQYDFLSKRADSTGTIAMLIDGPWWINEAKDSFAKMAASQGEKYSMKNSKFGWMPLPYATKEQVGQKSVFVDNLYGAAFVNANVASKPTAVKNLVLDFFQFAHTDWSLATFTAQTNAVRGFNYTLNILTEQEKENMCYYSINLIKYIQNSYKSFSYGDSKVYRLNNSNMKVIKRYARSSATGDTFPLSVYLKNGSISAGAYIKSMSDYYGSTAYTNTLAYV